MKTMFLRPRSTEKTYGLSLARNVYVVDVPNDANKLSVASAVAAQFGVTVLAVNIVKVKGKVKRTVRKGGRAVQGQRSDVKKAYVTLKAGNKLPFFQTEEDQAKKADKKGKK